MCTIASSSVEFSGSNHSAEQSKLRSIDDKKKSPVAEEPIKDVLRRRSGVKKLNLSEYKVKIREAEVSTVETSKRSNQRAPHPEPSLESPRKKRKQSDTPTRRTVDESRLKRLQEELELIVCVTKLNRRESVVVEIDTQKDKVTIVGDLHGSLVDLFQAIQWYVTNNSGIIIFNGDFMDRGKDNIAVLLTLCELKKRSANRVYLLRGNHETNISLQYINSGFKDFLNRYGEENATVLTNFFQSLSYMALINNSISVCHGCPNDTVNLSSLKDAPKVTEPWPNSVLHDLIWCDPKLQTRGRSASTARGPDNQLAVGKDLLQLFCESNRQEVIIRSHEHVNEGVRMEHFHKYSLLTVFTHSDYCDMKNLAAIAFVDEYNRLSYTSWTRETALQRLSCNKEEYQQFFKYNREIRPVDMQVFSLAKAQKRPQPAAKLFNNNKQGGPILHNHNV